MIKWQPPLAERIFHMRKILILFLFFVCARAFAIGDNELKNPGLELDANGTVSGWRVMFKENTGHIDTKIFHGGKSSLYVEHFSGRGYFGLSQKIIYDSPSTAPVLFGGWSKAEKIVGELDYNIYLDMVFSDGSVAYGIKAYWNTGSHDWQYASSCYRPTKPIREISYHILFRKNATGKAWFDDFELRRGEPDVQIGAVTMESTAPLSQNGFFIKGMFFRNVNYKAILQDDAGNDLLAHNGTGREIRWFAEPEKKVAKLQIQVSANGKSKTYTYPVNVNPRLPRNPVKENYQVWTADSMTNISPATYPHPDAPRDISLELAQAEAESAQIQVTAGARPLSGIKVILPELKTVHGEAFAGKIKWERVGYLPRRRPYAYHPDGYTREEFWIPDPLLPARDFNVPANATQGIWLTVRAGRKAKAGTYRGDVIISIDGNETKVPVSVRVFGFALPDTFSLRSAFCIMDNWLFKAYPWRKQGELRREAWDIMLEHRLNPDDITRTAEPCIEDLLYAQKKGMNQFCIFNLVPKPVDNPLWVCYSPVSDYNDALLEEFKARLDPYVAELRKYNLMKYAYVYGFDERWDEYYPVMNRIRKMLHERYPDLPFMTTARAYQSLKKNPSRKDCYVADWFCPTASVYVDTLSADLRKKGHQVWWYVCCSPQYPYANFASVEYPFIEGRLLAWQTFRHKADGLLYWHVNAWTDKFYFDESLCYQTAFKLNSIEEMPGDGQLLYPGAGGPLPSIRLANIRDGSEDYDYLAMYGEKGRDFCKKLAPSMTKFSRDPRQLRAFRRQIAEALESRVQQSIPGK